MIAKRGIQQSPKHAPFCGEANIFVQDLILSGNGSRHTRKSTLTKMRSASSRRWHHRGSLGDFGCRSDVPFFNDLTATYITRSRLPTQQQHIIMKTNAWPLLTISLFSLCVHGQIAVSPAAVDTVVV